MRAIVLRQIGAEEMTGFLLNKKFHKNTGRKKLALTLISRAFATFMHRGKSICQSSEQQVAVLQLLSEIRGTAKFILLHGQWRRKIVAKKSACPI